MSERQDKQLPDVQRESQAVVSLPTSDAVADGDRGDRSPTNGHDREPDTLADETREPARDDLAANPDAAHTAEAHPDEETESEPIPLFSDAWFDLPPPSAGQQTESVAGPASEHAPPVASEQEENDPASGSPTATAPYAASETGSLLAPSYHGDALEQTSRSAPLARASAALSGLILLVVAGWPMQHQRLPLWATASLVAGAGAWIWSIFQTPPLREKLGMLSQPAFAVRRLPLIGAVILTLVAWLGTGDRMLHAQGTIPWLASILAWFWAFWPSRAKDTAKDACPPHLRYAIIAGVVLAIITGLWFRFYLLDKVPGNPTSDHAEKLLDVYDVLQGQRPIFFPRNTGREPWHFYWAFLLIRIFGLPLRYMTLKISTAIMGTLAVPAIFLLGQEFGGPLLGLLGAFSVAWGKWPTETSRIGLRFSLAVFPTALVLWALFRYMRRGDRASALWAGWWLGCGLFGYISFRIVPLLVPLCFGVALLDPRRRTGAERRRLLLDGLLIVGTAVIVFLPLLHFMLSNPDQFWSRVVTRAGSAERAIGDQPVVVLVRNIFKMLLAFNWRGDVTVFNSVQNDPFLDPVIGALLLAGIVVAVRAAGQRSLRWLVVLISVLLLTLPSTLSIAFPVENPATNRAVTAIPVIFLLAGLAVIHLGRLLVPLGRPAKGVTLAVALVLMAASVQQNYQRYFVDYRQQYNAMFEHTAAMAQIIRDYEAQGIPANNVYALNAPYWMDGRNIGFELGLPHWADAHNIDPGVPTPVRQERPLLFLFRPNDQLRVSELTSHYQGELRIIQQVPHDRDFGVLIVR